MHNHVVVVMFFYLSVVVIYTVAVLARSHFLPTYVRSSSLKSGFPPLSPSTSLAAFIPQEGTRRGVTLPAAQTGSSQNSDNRNVQGHDHEAEVHELSAIGK